MRGKGTTLARDVRPGLLPPGWVGGPRVAGERADE